VVLDRPCQLHGRAQVAVSVFLEGIAIGPTSLVIEGGPGTGKTRLFNACVAAAADQATLLTTRPLETERRLPYSGLNDLLEAVLDDTLQALPVPQARALQLALQRINAPRPPTPQAVAFGVLGILRILAVERPVLLAIDSVQWLDDESFDVLAFAFRRLRSQRVGLLATIRNLDHTCARHSVLLRLGGDERQWMRLEPMSLLEQKRMLEQQFSMPVALSLLRSIHSASGGNPALAIELVERLRDGGVKPRAGEPLPLPLRAGVPFLATVRNLSVPAREVVLLTAVLSNPTLEVIVRCVRDEDAALRGIEAASAAGVICCDGNQLSFTNPLWSLAAYEHASPPERRRAHNQAARALSDAVEAARHAGLAASEPDADVARRLDSAALACEHAARLTAAELLELAADLTPPCQTGELFRRLLGAGRLYLESGDALKAEGLLEQAAMLGQTKRERAEAHRYVGALHALRTNWRLAGQDWADGRIQALGTTPLQSELALDHALATFTSGSVRLALHELCGVFSEAQSACVAELAQARVAMFSFVCGNRSHEEALAAMAREQGSVPTLFALLPGDVAGALNKWSDRFDEARALLSARIAVYRRNASQPNLATSLNHLSELECLTGHWMEAEAHAVEADEIALLGGMDALRAGSLYARALMEALRGHLESAERLGSHSLQLATSADNVLVANQARWALGFVELSRGEPAAAEAHLRQVEAELREFGAADPGIIRFQPDAIEALIGLGQLDEAESMLVRFEEVATRYDRPSALATAARARALLMSARGKLADGEAAIQLARRWHTHIEMPFELGRTLLVQGIIERRARRRRDARQTLANACSLFENLGAAAWRRRAERELGRIGGRTASPAALTTAEQRIAELVRAGYSNRQIADRLFISVNTVQTTLKHIFQKMAVESRTELAARLTSVAPATAPSGVP
jgi:DNA-binding CsgD family transcriptional regulator